MTTNQTLSIKIKVTLGKDTKTFKKPDTYMALLQQTVKSFGAEQLPQNFKFYYSDEEGDIISISCQEDYEEAYENASSTLKLVIEASSSAAKHNMPLNAPVEIVNFGFSTNTNESVIFEDIKSQNNMTDIKRMDSVPSLKSNSEESKVSSKQSLESQILSQHVASVLATAETVFPCFTCEGKGLACLICQGSGKASKDFSAQLVNTLRTLIKDILNNPSQECVQEQVVIEQNKEEEEPEERVSSLLSDE